MNRGNGGDSSILRSLQMFSDYVYATESDWSRFSIVASYRLSIIFSFNFSDKEAVAASLDTKSKCPMLETRFGDYVGIKHTNWMFFLLKQATDSVSSLF